MFHRSTTAVRLTLASTTVIAMLSLTSGSAAAATGPANGSFSQDGKSADGGADACVSNGDGTSSCSSIGISIFVGKRSDSLTKTTNVSQVCVNAYRYVVDDSSGDVIDSPVFESGCRDGLAASAIRFANKLASATLAPTSIEIGQEICSDKYDCEPGPTRHVTVAGTWTGVGATTFARYSSFFDDGTCRVTDSSKGSSRGATFRGTFDGLLLSQDFASISDGKSSSSTRCIGG